MINWTSRQANWQQADLSFSSCRTDILSFLNDGEITSEKPLFRRANPPSEGFHPYGATQQLSPKVRIMADFLENCPIAEQ